MTERIFLDDETRHFYLAGDGSDSTGIGTLAAPWRQPMHAIRTVKRLYDQNGFQPYIHFEDGSYEPWQDYGPPIGLQPVGGGPPVFYGNPTNPENVSVTSSGSDAVSYDGGAQGVIIGMTFSASGKSAVYATNNAIIEIGLLRFGTANQQIMADAGGSIFVTSTLDFVQGAYYGMLANLGGLIEVVPGVHVKFGSGIGYTQFLFAVNGGKVVWPYIGITVESGNPTGQKLFASLGGIVNTGGSILESTPFNSMPGGSVANPPYNYGGIVY